MEQTHLVKGNFNLKSVDASFIRDTPFSQIISLDLLHPSLDAVLFPSDNPLASLLIIAGQSKDVTSQSFQWGLKLSDYIEGRLVEDPNPSSLVKNNRFSLILDNKIASVGGFIVTGTFLDPYICRVVGIEEKSQGSILYNLQSFSDGTLPAEYNTIGTIWREFASYSTEGADQYAASSFGGSFATYHQNFTQISKQTEITDEGAVINLLEEKAKNITVFGEMTLDTNARYSGFNDTGIKKNMFVISEIEKTAFKNLAREKAMALLLGQNNNKGNKADNNRVYKAAAGAIALMKPENGGTLLDLRGTPDIELLLGRIDHVATSSDVNVDKNKPVVITGGAKFCNNIMKGFKREIKNDNIFNVIADGASALKMTDYSDVKSLIPMPNDNNGLGFALKRNDTYSYGFNVNSFFTSSGRKVIVMQNDTFDSKLLSFSKTSDGLYNDSSRLGMILDLGYEYKNEPNIQLCYNSNLSNIVRQGGTNTPKFLENMGYIPTLTSAHNRITTNYNATIKIKDPRGTMLIKT